MDEKDFKKHLQDLVHGHHHPEEHDWAPDSNVRKTGVSSGTKTVKTAGSRAHKTNRKSGTRRKTAA